GFQLPSYTPPAGTYTFADVPPANPFWTVVETAVYHHLANGYSCGGPGEPCDPEQHAYFRPYTDVTRAQLAKLVVVAAGWPITTSGGPHFHDVLPADPFYGWIETAYGHGVISGYADGTFRPGANATRGQIAKIAYGAISAP